MNTTDHRADQIEDRFIDFAVGVITLCGKLPVSYASDRISRQMLRSGTALAPNYGEARGTESGADFAHKLKIALKELNETSVWLRMILRAKLTRREMVDPVLDECRQLARILNASIQTARRNAP